jgi:predicted porin
VQNSPDRSDSDTKAYGIGYRYDFSKRTAVYTSLTYYDNDGNVVRAAAAVPTKVAVPVLGDQEVLEFVAGIRHSF